MLAGAVIAFGFLISYPILVSGEHRLSSILKGLEHPSYPWLYAIVIASLILAIAAVASLEKLRRSLRLGLLTLTYWISILAVAVSLILFELRHVYSAFGVIVVSGALGYAFKAIRRIPPAEPTESDYMMDPDLPLGEDGKDLLDRGAIVARLENIIVRERPSVVALIGGYGDGKTSLLNLTIGQLRKRDEDQRPIIVKFSPWLPGNSSALVTSLLTSITADIRREYVFPGLNQSVSKYARVLMGAIPKAEALKELFTDASQQERLQKLAEYVARMPRRILVVLDDLDRMHAKELETVFKILRGAEELSSVSFLCSFDLNELAAILKSSRRFQDTLKFIDKFFQIKVAVPKIDSAMRKELFREQMSRLRPGEAEVSSD